MKELHQSFSENQTERGQTGRGENENKQRDGEKLVSEIPAQICVNSKSLGGGVVWMKTLQRP